jgi:hypothetical protein
MSSWFSFGTDGWLLVFRPKGLANTSLLFEGLDFCIMVGSREFDHIELVRVSLQRVLRDCLYHRTRGCSFRSFSVGWTQFPSAQNLAVHLSPHRKEKARSSDVSVSHFALLFQSFMHSLFLHVRRPDST